MSASKLVLGTVQFGLNYGIANTQGKPSFEKVKDILSRAHEYGIHMLDTAAAYGDSEKVLGRALKELRLKDEMWIVSKIMPLPSGITADEAGKIISGSLETSLRNLGVECLHAILFHREEDVRFFDILKNFSVHGYAKSAGASLDGRVPEGAEKLEAAQIPSNVFDRRFLPFLHEAHKRGTFLFVRSVYLQGLLVMPEEKIPASLSGLVALRRNLEKIAVGSGMDMAELCMRYLFSIPEIDGVLTGVDSVEQLEVNAALASKGALPEEVFNAVLSAVPELPETLIRPSLWKK